MQKLYDYIYERGTIIPIVDYDRHLLSHGDVSKRVTESIRANTKEWESLVSWRSIVFVLSIHISMQSPRMIPLKAPQRV